MESKPKAKLHYLFLNMFLPLITIAIVSGGVLAFISNSVIGKYVQTQAFLSIERLNSQIGTYFSPIELTIQNFAKSAQKTNDEQVLESTLLSLAEGIDFSNGLYYGTKQSRFSGGLYLDSTGWIPEESWEPKNRPWFLGAEAEKYSVHFEEPYVDDQTGNVCVTVAKAAVDENGEVFGVVGVDLMMDEIAAMVESVKVSENGVIYIVSEDGAYLTNSDSSKIMAANYFSESKIGERASQYLDGTTKAFFKNGRYYAVCKIGNTPWFIVAEGPVADFNKSFVHLITIFEVLIALLCIGFALFNLRVIKKLRQGDRETSKKIFAESQNLVSVSKENATTAQEQSAAVKEIVATMEDNNARSEHIAEKIKDVAGVANATNANVANGVGYLEMNAAQMSEIASANQTTIEGIKELGKKIENIWDIVTLINTVADQAKIIAFNAELEASSAGEAGKNFHIVASEIRRLADGIINGTKEIKESISEIQQSSDSLILTSESGTEKIRAGVENAKSLEESFQNIKNASEITAASANDITAIIQQQAHSSEQILIMLKQIASGVEKFAHTTASLSGASENIQSIATVLNK
ncbi:MAG: hypothetical protein II811_07925 [Spirochaetaceae bacterium]|nr:hypothetical protein [Spirochaetaceae bacterium]